METKSRTLMEMILRTKDRKTSFVLWGHIIYKNLRLEEANRLVQKLDIAEQLVENVVRANLKTVRD